MCYVFESCQTQDYGGAQPFFDTVDVIGSQQGAYFVLENANWAIIGLDTALNDSDPAETAKGVKVWHEKKKKLKNECVTLIEERWMDCKIWFVFV